MCNFQTGIGTTRGYWHYLITAWKYRFPHDSRAALTAGAGLLRSERIDIAALCELEASARRTRGIDQLATIADAAGLPHTAFFPALVSRDHLNQGNGVCSRFPVTATANHRLPGTGEPRFLSEAQVGVGSRPIRLLVTHLALAAPDRRLQVERILELVSDSSEPTILAGDFNISHRRELEILAETPLDQSVSAPTFPSWNPRRHLDHLFFTKHFEILASHAPADPLFSDHLPLIAEVSYSATAQYSPG